MKVSVVRDLEDNYRVVVQLGNDAHSGRLALPPSDAMDLATDLIRASLDARFRNANSIDPDVVTDAGIPA